MRIILVLIMFSVSALGAPECGIHFDKNAHQTLKVRESFTNQYIFGRGGNLLMQTTNGNEVTQYFQRHSIQGYLAGISIRPTASGERSVALTLMKVIPKNGFQSITDGEVATSTGVGDRTHILTKSSGYMQSIVYLFCLGRGETWPPP